MKHTQSQLVGASYIADALGQSRENISRALVSLFAGGEWYIQEVPQGARRIYLLPRQKADRLISEWSDHRKRGAPKGNQNARKRKVKA